MSHDSVPRCVSTSRFATPAKSRRWASSRSRATVLGTAVQKTRRSTLGSVLEQHDSDDEPHAQNGQPEAQARPSIARSSQHWQKQTKYSKCSVCRFRSLQEAITRHEVWLRKAGRKRCCRRRDEPCNMTRAAQSALTALKIELTEPQQANVSINMVTATTVQMQLMDRKSVRKTPGAQGVNPSTEHTSFATNHTSHQNLL